MPGWSRPAGTLPGIRLPSGRSSSGAMHRPGGTARPRMSGSAKRSLCNFDEPSPMSLWHLSASSQAQADSLYALLDQRDGLRDSCAAVRRRFSAIGAAFLGRWISAHTSRVSGGLRDLHEGEYTGPIRVGEQIRDLQKSQKGGVIVGKTVGHGWCCLLMCPPVAGCTRFIGH